MALPQSRSSFLVSRAVTIPANGETYLNITGNSFHVKEADDTFEMAFNDGDYFAIEAGLGFQLPGEDYFQKLSFRNTSGSDIAIVIYVSSLIVLDNRLVQPIAPTITVNSELVNDLTSCIKVAPTVDSRTAVIATPGRLAGSANTFFRKVLVKAKDSNTDNVTLGISATASDRPITLAPGDEYFIEVPVGCKQDLYDWFIGVAVDNEGVDIVKFA